jgi:ubiquinone/menaquinone biosynthesis C-methylase UbiE
MNAGDVKFAGSIPVVYERHLVPLLFEPYARDLAARLAGLESGRLIEVAAGTGALTRAIARALPSTVEMVATDLNEAMLRVGEANFKAENDRSVRFQHADARSLPFDDASADTVVCQFGIMFLPDKLAAFREARRVLRARGRYIFNSWDQLAKNELSEIVAAAVAQLFPSDPPTFYERMPFGYADVEAIRSDLERAGFTHIAIETVQKTARAPSAEDAAFGLCQGTPLRNEIEARNPELLDEATRRAADAIRARYGNGPFEHSMSAHVATAALS